MTIQHIIDRLYHFLTRRVVYHSLFWLTLFYFLMRSATGNGPFFYVLINELVSIGFYVLLVYFNLRFLIPSYLAKRAGLYFLFLILACVVITPIKVMAFFLLAGGDSDVGKLLQQSQRDILIGFLAIALLSTLLRVLTDWWRYQQDKQQLEAQSLQSELRFLRAQINPHFLFNTLNNLYSLTLKKSDRAPDIVLKLSEIMRYMLYECNEKEVLLANEVQYIQNYLDLERLRLAQGASAIEFDVTGVIEEQKIAPLLFVPFLENSFKHGLNQQIGGTGFVRIRLDVHQTHLEFTVINNKSSGPTEYHRDRSGGIGLVNVRQRLNILYPNRHELLIDDQPGSYSVFLRVDF